MAGRPADRRPRRAPRRRPDVPERLEGRILMAEGAFAAVEGVLAPGERRDLPLRITPQDFDAARGLLVLRLDLHADGDGSLDPMPPSVAGEGRRGVRVLGNRTLGDGAARSLVAARLGTLAAGVAGADGSAGAFRLDVALAGDLDGDGRVDRADLFGVRERLGAQAGSDRYLDAADLDGDGRVTARDWWLTRWNLGAATTVRPLDVTVGLDPASDPDGDGRIASGTPAELRGATLPGATVRLDVGADWSFEQATVSGADGSYRFTLDPAEGVVTLRVEASDAFGQRVAARTRVEWLAPGVRRAATAVGRTLETVVRPGGLEGTEVSYTITPQPLPANLTFDRTSGALRFVPAPDQVGTHEFTVVAKQGGQSVTERLTISVSHPELPEAVVSGVVVDEAGAPLAGVPVQLGEARAVTDADGRFRLVGVPDGVAPVVLDGPAAPGGDRLRAMAPVDQLLGHPVYDGADNAIPAALTLPRVDTANGIDFATLDPSRAHDLTSPALPGVVLHVPAGAAVTEDGRPFAGLLTLTALAVDRMRPFLPSGVNPGVMIGVDGEGLRFDTPARITLPNTAGHPPGAEFDLMAMNPVTGAFQDSGTLRVSDDGTRIETVAGGLTASSCIGFNGQPAGPTSQYEQCRGCQVPASGGIAPPGGPPGVIGLGSRGGPDVLNSDVGLATGEFFDHHTLVPYRSQGAVRGIALEYSSLHADPRPVIHLQPRLQDHSSTPHTIKAAATLGGVGQGAAVSYSTSGVGLSFGDPYRVPVQVDASALATGLHPFEVDITHVYGSSPPVELTGTVTGTLDIVNTADGPYGAGWSVAGLQRVHAASATSSALVTQGAQGNERYSYRAGGPIHDLAVVVGGNARILRNDGDGNFTLASPARAVPDGAVDAAAGDFDGDGLADLVVASAATFAHGDQVALLTADGSDGFDAPAATALGAKPLAVLAGHFNSDSDLDLVVSLDDGTVAMLPGDGSGGFGTAVISTVGGGSPSTHAKPGTIAAGDLDGDGSTDLVVSANGDHKLRVLLNDGSGSFTATAYTLPTSGGTGGHAGQVAVGDLTGDGDLDIAVAHANTNSILSMLVGDGSGGFTHTSLIDAYTDFKQISRMTIGDFYGDGQAAVAAWFLAPSGAQRGASGASIIPGSTSGTWQQESIVLYDNDGDPFISTTGIAAADLNGDGRPDMAAINGTGAPRVLLTNPELNQLREVREIVGGAAALVAAAPFTGRSLGARYVGPASDPSVLVRNGDGTWERSYPDGTVVDFDASGRQVTVTDRNGNTTTFSYVAAGAAAGALESITDPVGLRTTLAYDANGKLRTVTDPAGRVTTLTVDGSGNLTEIEDPDGATSQFSYAGHRITGQVDPRGHTVTVSYDSFGRFVSESLPGALGTVTAVGGESIGLLAPGGSGTLPLPSSYRGTVTDPNGKTTTFAFDAMSHPTAVTDALGKTTSYTYNDRGWVATATDPLGRKTTYAYDDRGNVTKVTRHDNTYMEIDYDASFSQPTRVRDFRGKVTTFTLDSEGNVTRRTDPDLDHEDFTYDAAGLPLTATDRNGNTTTFAYDSLGRLTTITYPGTGTPTARLAYDAAGNLTRVTDELGHATTFTYDLAGRIRTAQDPVQAAAGTLATFTYDPSGNLTKAEDANGHATTFAYDARGRLVGSTEPVHQGTGKQTTYTYDGMNLVRVEDPLGHATTYAYDAVNRPTTVIDPTGATATLVYDNAGQLSSVVDPNGNRTTYTYDAVGRLKTVTQPGTVPGPWGFPTSVVTTYDYDANGNRTRVTDPLGHATSFSYDDLNRLTATSRQADWSTTLRTTYTYDAVGNRTRVTDGLGHATTFSYDERNRVTTEVRPAGGGTTTFSYDLAGRLTSLTDPVGNVTSFAYDAANRLTSETDPLGETTTHAYDLVGNRTATTDRLGRIREFGRDANDRLVTEAWKPSGGGSTLRTVTWTYDDAGRLTGLADPDSTHAYGYDDAGRLTSADNDGTPGQPRVLLTYTYDPAGNRTSVRDNHGGVTSYAYDVRNWLEQVTQSGSGVAEKRVDLKHDAAGRRTELTRYSNLAGSATVLVSAYTYDDADRLTNLTHKTAGGTTRASYAYTLDAASRLTQEVRTWTTSGGTASDTVGYSYTNDGQLTGVTHTNGSFSGESFSYDANGNRTMTGYGTGTGNRLSGDGTYTYDYNDEGNLVTRTETATGAYREFAYDHRNRLTSVTDRTSGGSVTGQVTYTYDALDRRIEVDDGTDTLKVAYDGQAAILDFDGSNAQTARYLPGPMIDELLARETGSGTVAWYLQDRLNTVRDLADNSGAIINHVDYDAFGAVVAESAPGVGDRFGFTGRERDAVTGLQYNRARYYDAAIGRWTQEDPIGFAGGDPNLFRYVENSPTIFTDPTGLIGIFIDGAGQPYGRPTNIQEMFEWYRSGDKFLYVDTSFLHNPGRIDKIVRNIRLYHKRNPCEPVDLFGWSRGGYYTFMIAQELEKHGIEVRFLGLFDPVANPVLPIFYDNRAPFNVKYIWKSRVDGTPFTANPIMSIADMTIFQPIHIKFPHGWIDQNRFVLEIFSGGHDYSGFDDRARDSMMSHATSCGVKFNRTN